MKEEKKRLDEMIMHAIGDRYRTSVHDLCHEPLPEGMQKLLAEMDGTSAGGHPPQGSASGNAQRRSR
ncbi:hypothetical protein [Methylobrevis albus]|uniref:Anti-sigma factor NepR domain-containing protein n=1 Tax=Methylobrevis albus TaxID=2793297 RepID=A0A931MZ26_9HYPH|nr:hypothetical protein [Methylobrevis albus]MBH0239047.1 hypothetical protein [Methylobrevis albus]